MKIVIAWLCMTTATVFGHDEPTSFVNVHMQGTSVAVEVITSVIDLAHDLPQVEPAMLLQDEVMRREQTTLVATIVERMKFTSAGKSLTLGDVSVTAIPEKRDLRFIFTLERANTDAGLNLQCLMFPYDKRHQTFVTVYENDQLIGQKICDVAQQQQYFSANEQRSLLAVFGQFTLKGIHHIFIGPDHILFIVSLLLLGGTLKQLCKVLTAFTLAHSITLGLATFHLVNPPSSWIEPVIALSIVVVGIHAFMAKGTSDPRMWFALVFGLIHGFGFANVLQETALPTAAFGWALFAFNVGVELGQIAIVIAILPVFAAMRKTSAARTAPWIRAVAALVIVTGTFWFFERIM